jgi:cysteinyl-tRNA synthetase
MYFSQGHWRQPMEYDDARLTEAAAFAQRIREAGRRLSGPAEPSPEWSAALRERYFDALADDFNTPRGLAAVAEWVRRANGQPARSVGGADLAEMLDVLGLAALLEVDEVAVPADAQRLLEARDRARSERDWTEADRLRDELRVLGWEIRDGPDGPELRSISPAWRGGA